MWQERADLLARRLKQGVLSDVAVAMPVPGAVATVVEAKLPAATAAAAAAAAAAPGARRMAELDRISEDGDSLSDSDTERPIGGLLLNAAPATPGPSLLPRAAAATAPVASSELRPPTSDGGERRPVTSDRGERSMSIVQALDRPSTASAAATATAVTPGAVPGPAGGGPDPGAAVLSSSAAGMPATASASAAAAAADAGAAVATVTPTATNAPTGGGAEFEPVSRETRASRTAIVSVEPMRPLGNLEGFAAAAFTGAAESNVMTQRRMLVGAESPEATHVGAERAAALMAASTLDPRVLWAGVMQARAGLLRVCE